MRLNLVQTKACCVTPSDLNIKTFLYFSVQKAEEWKLHYTKIHSFVHALRNAITINIFLL